VNAAELIALLKSHPKACGRLGFDVDGKTMKIPGLGWISTTLTTVPLIAENTLTGAAANEFVRRGWTLPDRRGPNYWRSDWHRDAHPTILHALLAAIEAAQ
jgi:hypothetical protein